MQEVWKDVKGYEGLYQISNLGRVKSMARQNSKRLTFKEKILNPRLDGKGYLFVALYQNNVPTETKVHRLVSMAFINNPENKPTVNHKDENKTNNCVKNLEWATHKENSNYGTRNEKLRRKVYQFDLDGTFIRVWEGLSIAAKELGIDGSAISKCCIGKLRQSGSFIWKYDKEVG